MIEDIARQLGSFGASYASFARVASGKKFEGLWLPKDITSGKQQDSWPRARGRTLRGTRCERHGPRSAETRRRRCSFIAEERRAPRWAHAAATRRAHGGCGQHASPMKEYRLLGAPSLLPASAMRAPPQSSATGGYSPLSHESDRSFAVEFVLLC